jgi:hypothetical protein
MTHSKNGGQSISVFFRNMYVICKYSNKIQKFVKLMYTYWHIIFDVIFPLAVYFL